MLDENIEEVLQLCLELNDLAQSLKAEREALRSKGYYFSTSMHHAALKRRSMDLTRALSKMRNQR